MDATTSLQKKIDVENHPLVDDVNQMHREQLSRAERVCKKISDATGAPLALLAVIVVQLVWVLAGNVTHIDPYPFAFLLTVSNILQLVLIFVIAVAQRQSSEHSEIRAESDHDSISRLLYHQQLQNELLLRIAERTGAQTADLGPLAQQLAAEG
ncbi:MAG: DUF1003 domain-containing protein [Candidatus Eremiobacteraeota bacterium]|nr:DUF1003 domain-containing protein [Candidatus Eremiobacteraeota bacterium]